MRLMVSHREGAQAMDSDVAGWLSLVIDVVFVGMLSQD
jgi:hypothetical protein